ncbi:hypothetical protein HHK36_009197 [Tetracentron sinense]|uniref:Uncharacterized protein n=1 Tax=Tetracentron sinense TaxID=13715 RepID=A0A835DLF4_TETSI|nr:hypothetical protein HHK36_009197 [Tetracentron sinense]
MNGYSKIKYVSTTKSRSIDFSDLFSPPHTPKPISSQSPNLTYKTQENKEINNINTKNTNTNDFFTEQENEDGVGERFGVILSRNCSVSSTSSNRIKAEKQNPATLQSAVRRAFSMRRSSSISEGYCRIHDQSEPVSSLIDDDGLNTKQTRSKKKRGKILKACKRLFGF